MISKKNKMNRSSEPVLTSVNLICEGTIINGDIEGKTDFRIDGAVTGALNIKGKIVVGETGNIQGDIFCKTIDVLGKVHGNIEASELVTIKAGANIQGDIFSGKIAVEPGAKIMGSCNIGDVNINKSAKKGGA